MKYKYHTGIECPKCLDRIFSWHRHDFKYCKCKEVFVDGGFDYLRYGYCKDGSKPKVIKKRFYKQPCLSPECEAKYIVCSNCRQWRSLNRFIPSVRGNSA